MDPLTFDHGDLHLRADRGVCELRGPAGDERTWPTAAPADRRVG